MVSTRQMATSGGTGATGSSNNNNNSSSTANNNVAVDEISTRFSLANNRQLTTANRSNPTDNNVVLVQSLSPNISMTSSTGAVAGQRTFTGVLRHSAAAEQYIATDHDSDSSIESINDTAYNAYGDGNGLGYNDFTVASCSSSPTGVDVAANQLQPLNRNWMNLMTNEANGANCSTACLVAIAQVGILDLPVEIIALILSYFDYKSIAQMRVISHKFNDICKHLLNSTFSKLITFTYNRFNSIKSQMPRRESQRRNHPLSCEADIIETCYMRLSLLQMTFGKHIERGHCCFFPGGILDEVFAILRYIKNTPNLQRPYRVTDELFDISTMAMEYFRDHIEPTLPDLSRGFNKNIYKLPPLVITSDLSDSSAASSSSPPQSNMVLRKGIRRIKQGMKIYNNQLSCLRNELRTSKRKAAEQSKQIAEQQKLLAEQQKQAIDYANRLDENDKKCEELSRKFSSLMQELNKCKTELQYWRSKSPAVSTCSSCGQRIPHFLPPEDFQALINQGVKPEDILNLSDDVDNDNDNDVQQQQQQQQESNSNNCDTSTAVDAVVVMEQNEFVLPDQATTAKLLAVNTATKNLKRQYSSMLSNSNNSSNDEQTVGVVDNHQQQQQEAVVLTKDLNDRGSVIAGALPAVERAAFSGCHPKIFYGLGCVGGGGGSGLSSGGSANIHKSVIVAPTKLAKQQMSVAELHENATESKPTTSKAAAAISIELNELNNEHVNPADVATAAANVASGVDDVVTLQAITAVETTKKARRVQKTTRSVNACGKRSK